MKRPRRVLLVLLAALVAAGGATWLAARAPSRYARTRMVERFHEQRAERVREALAALDRVRSAGVDPAGTRRRERAFEEALGAVGRREVRGWELLLVPPGGRPPDPAGFLVAGTHDPSAPDDPVWLQGPVEVWIAPRGALARLASGLGLAP